MKEEQSFTHGEMVEILSGPFAKAHWQSQGRK